MEEAEAANCYLCGPKNPSVDLAKSMFQGRRVPGLKMSEVRWIHGELAAIFRIRETDGLCRRWMTDRSLLRGLVVQSKGRD